MIVQHNIPALNSHRNMGINNAKTSKNLEKLSSGFRINRAADDAAGLAVSEKMRGQIRGLAQAENNVKYGVALIQTAEGALDETHNILQRMRELAVASSNETLKYEDRIQYTKEFEALKSEIDRISESTHYNNIKLLDGSLGGTSSGSGTRMISAKDVDMTFASASTQLSDPAVFTDGTKAKFTLVPSAAVGSNDAALTGVYSLTYDDGSGNANTINLDISWTNGAAAAATDVGKAIYDAVDKAGLSDLFDVTYTAASGTITFEAKEAGITGTPKILSGDLVVKSSTATADAALVNDTTATGVAQTLTYATKGVDAKKELDLSKLTVMSVTDAKALQTNGNDNAALKALEDATFTVNGKTFVLMDQDADQSILKDGQIALVMNSATGTAAAIGADVASWVETIKNATGLDISANGTKIETKGSQVGSTTGKGGLTFQIGANGSKDQQVNLSINKMDSKSLGVSSEGVKFTKLTGASVASASIETKADANAAIDIIAGASNMVATQRAELGALQNRLESTLNSLGVAKENLTSAEATIRDVDMAKEMMEFTKNNILVQASQAMLAQANQLPQGVLQLLR